MQASELDALIEEAAKLHNVPADLIRKVVHQESAGNPGAVSPVGASGLMQLMPDTAKEMGVTNLTDPKQNLFGGVKYLGQLLSKYNGDTRLALAAYNAGMGNVKKYGGIPPFKETQNYVDKISPLETPNTFGFEQPPPSDTPILGNPAPAQVVPPIPPPFATTTLPTPEPSPSPSPMPSPEIVPAKPVSTSSTAQPKMVKYIAKDTETGEEYPIELPEGQPEPTDEEIDDHITRIKAQDSKDSLGSRLMESPNAQMIRHPLDTLGSLLSGAKREVGAAFNPMAKNEGMIPDMIHAGQERATPFFAQAMSSPDTLTSLARGAQGVLASTPLIDRYVEPLDTDIQSRNPAGVAGTLLGAGLDIGSLAYGPEKVMEAPGAARQALRPMGRSIEASGEARLADNIKNPMNWQEIRKDMYSRAPIVGAASAVGLGIPAAKIAGIFEAGKMVSRSRTLAKVQRNLGRAMAGDPGVSASMVAEAAARSEGMNPGIKIGTAIEDASALDSTAVDPKVLDPEAVPTSDELWGRTQVTDKTTGRQSDVGSVDPVALDEAAKLEEPPVAGKTAEELWAESHVVDKPVGLQDTTEPVRDSLPVIAGKEGKKLYGEDQNFRSKAPKATATDEEILTLDNVDNIDALWKQDEIKPGPKGTLVDTTKVTPKPTVTVDPNAPVVPFGDFSAGDRIQTAGGKGGELVKIDGPTATIKLDSGQTIKLAKKSIKKVEGSGTGPKVSQAEAQVLVDGLEEPKPGFIRLYRGEGSTNKPMGKWFSNSIKDAEIYGSVNKEPKGVITYVDVPEEVANLGIVQKASFDPDYRVSTELPIEWANKAKKLLKKESLTENINQDPFGVEPVRQASGARRTIEKKLGNVEAPPRSTPRTTRDKLIDPTRTGTSPRQMGTSPRILKELKKAGVEFSPEEVRTVMETGDKTVRARGTPKKGLNVIDDGKKKVYAYYDGQGKLVAYGQADIATNTITDRFKWTKGFEEADRASLRKETRFAATKAADEVLDAMVNDGFEPPKPSKRSPDAIKSWHRYKANRSRRLRH